MRIYISGPMTGCPEYAKEFAKREEKLRMQGYDAVNPARISDIIRTDMSWDEWMSIDIGLLKVCDAIYMMPGYKNSCGANRELGFAMGAGMKVIFEEE